MYILREGSCQDQDFVVVRRPAWNWARRSTLEFEGRATGRLLGFSSRMLVPPHRSYPKPSRF